MNTLYFILLLLGAVSFALAAYGVVYRKVNLAALGLLFWIMVPLIQTLKRL
jgi:hypothetical protein